MKYSEARDNLRDLLQSLTGNVFTESELDDIEYAAVAVRLARAEPQSATDSTASAVVLGCPGAREEAEAFVEAIGRRGEQ